MMKYLEESSCLQFSFKQFILCLCEYMHVFVQIDKIILKVLEKKEMSRESAC